MWYAIIGTDNANSLEARKAARPAHLARLQQLQVAGIHRGRVGRRHHVAGDRHAADFGDVAVDELALDRHPERGLRHHRLLGAGQGSKTKALSQGRAAK